MHVKKLLPDNGSSQFSKDKRTNTEQECNARLKKVKNTKRIVASCRESCTKTFFVS